MVGTLLVTSINRDVPQEVIRVLLDHDSHRMTSHYAKITDQTVRRRWEQATKVDINGERVTIDPDGPLGQAQCWPAGSTSGWVGVDGCDWRFECRPVMTDLRRVLRRVVR